MHSRQKYEIARKVLIINSVAIAISFTLEGHSVRQCCNVNCDIAYIVDQDQNVGLNRPPTSDFRRT